MTDLGVYLQQFFIFLNTLLSLSFRKFGPPYLGKATVAARAVLASPTNACWVFSCFHNPPNFDTDYRIFNVHTGSFLCMHIYTRGLGTQTASQHAIFYWEKLTSFSCAPDRIRTSGHGIHWISLEADAQPIEPPLPPQTMSQF